MKTEVILELIGYVGSAFVLISFLMSTVIKLRIINSIGSLISVAYGIFIHAYPTVVMNAALFLINCFYLIKMFRYKESFHIIETNLSDSSVKFFINLNKEDILLYFPDFEANTAKVNFTKLIYVENKIAGLFAAEQKEDKSLNIILDYTTKEYRDYSVGHYLYKTFSDENVTKIVFNQKSENHYKYLIKMGFSKQGDTFVMTTPKNF